MSIEPFILHALLGGTLIALMTGALGCFVVWQRLSYYGDTVSHGALLGVALALLAPFPVALGIVLVAVLMGLALFALQRSRALSGDALLGVLAHAALALGMVVLALWGLNVDLHAYLFGDVLAISRQDLYTIGLSSFAVLAWIGANWRKLMMLVLHEDIARVEGLAADRLRCGLMLVIALAVAVSLKISGMLLVTALLIIPAAAARAFARTPGGMAVMASVLGILSVWGGIGASLRWDTPAGPSIILVSVAFFALSRLNFIKLSRF